MAAGQWSAVGTRRALAELAALSLQLGELWDLFDPFGQRLEMQGPAQLHDGVDEGSALGRLAHPGDERAIDLQRVDREVLEVGQRGVTRPEIDSLSSWQRPVTAPGITTSPSCGTSTSTLPRTWPRASLRGAARRGGHWSGKGSWAEFGPQSAPCRAPGTRLPMRRKSMQVGAQGCPGCGGSR